MQPRFTYLSDLVTAKRDNACALLQADRYYGRKVKVVSYLLSRGKQDIFHPFIPMKLPFR